MASSIQVSKDLKDALEKQKFTNKETYEEVIWDLLEDRALLSEQTQQNIAQAEKDIRAGKTISLTALKKKYGMK